MARHAGRGAVRAEINPELIRWARERARLEVADVARRFPRLDEWERGELFPTLKQLEDFASATRAPIGFFFLPDPPREEVPLPDFRTIRDQSMARPSPDLLDTVFLCQQRQEWYRTYARVNRADPLAFIGSLTTSTDVMRAAAEMRAALGFGLDERQSTWSDTLRVLAEHAESLGVLVMISGIVGSNTHRKLDPEEFRGFALVDEFAPVVFVNGSDTKSAQIFTLAHELAHLWLGRSALSNAEARLVPSHSVEAWCNKVAAEFLVPIDALHERFESSASLTAELERLAGIFKVSTLVVLRRIHDAGHLSDTDYDSAYRAELSRILGILGERGGEGGNFYNTQPVRVSKRFARAVIESTLEGRTLYQDALHMLGISKLATFHELAHRLGVT
jgi:Zn-dependent peptidase ImmA (M78 family)